MTDKKLRNQQVTRTVIPEKLVDLIEDLFHGFIGVLVFVIALISVWEGIFRFLNSKPQYPNGVIQSVNDILFVIILLEILRTVIQRFSDGTFQLENFLVIGVIASVRSILSVGASLALRTEINNVDFNKQILELIVSAGISLLLVFALWLSRLSKRTSL